MPSETGLGGGSEGDKGERSLDTTAPGDLIEEGVVLRALL